MQSLGVSTKVLQMENAKDPDEYVLKYGPERFEKLIDNSISSIEYKIKNLLTEYNLDNISEKIKFLSKLAEILARIDSNIEREIYVDKFAQDLKVGKEAIIAEIEKITLKKDPKIKITEQIKPIIDTKNINQLSLELENMIIYLLVQKDLKTYLRLSEVYSPNDAVLETHKRLISKLYEVYETGDISNKDLMSLCENDAESSILAENLIKENSKDELEKLTLEVVRKIEIDKLQKRKQELIKEIQSADTEEKRRLLEEELNDLIIKLAKR